MFPVALRREIAILLIVKAALLTTLYLLFFSPSHRVDVTPARVETHLLFGTR